MKGKLTAGVSATKDNGFTAASILVMYSGGPENLRTLFYVNDYDAVITVDREEEREEAQNRRIQDAPIRYTSEVPIHATALDKTGVTATKLLNKIRLSIISTIETQAQGPRATLIVRTDRTGNMIVGGLDPLWTDSYRIIFRPLAGSG